MSAALFKVKFLLVEIARIPTDWFFFFFSESFCSFFSQLITLLVKCECYQHITCHAASVNGVYFLVRSV